MLNTEESAPAPVRQVPIDQPARYAYRPALDGVRAIAVVAVLLYHGTLGWAQGGYLGVDLFFVLSGYLITTLLVTEFSGTSGIALTQFWLRRARRLLPALLVVLVGCALYSVFLADASQAAKIRGDAIASLLYVANWHFIFSGASYFDQFALPSPLRHMWSLAIEEQFYLVWPLVILGGLRVVGRTRHHWRTLWIVALSMGTVGSVALMAVMYGDGSNPSAAYYSTFSRAQALFIGAALAFLLIERDRLTRGWNQVLLAVGAVGFFGTFALFYLAEGTPGWMYKGGFTLMALFGACLIAGASRQDDNPLTALLGLKPLPQIGLISYGLYLYHWPIFVTITPERTGLHGLALLATRLTCTGAVAVVSYYALELPVRKGVLKRMRPVMLTGFAVVVTLLFVIVAGARVSSTATGATDGAPDATKLVETAAAPGDTRVMVVGDSIAWGFANEFTKKLVGGQISVINQAIIGCQNIEGQPLTTTGRAKMVDACNTRLDTWTQKVDSFDPNIAVMMPGGFEVYDHQVGDSRVVFGTEEYRKYFLQQMDQDIKVLSAKGAKVAILNVPCYQETVPGGLVPPNPERNDPSRPVWLNERLKEVAAAHPDTVVLIDLHDYLCPTGTYQDELNGVKIHRDGIHFSPEGAQMVWTWLGPKLKAISPPPGVKAGTTTTTAAH